MLMDNAMISEDGGGGDDDDDDDDDGRKAKEKVNARGVCWKGTVTFNKRGGYEARHRNKKQLLNAKT